MFRLLSDEGSKTVADVGEDVGEASEEAEP